MIQSLHPFFRLAIAIFVSSHFWLSSPQITFAEEIITPHPLNPLTEREVNTAVEILQREEN